MSESSNKSVDAVYEAALKLSADERELLLVMLEQHDAPGWASPEIEQAWLQEAQRRRSLRVAGKSNTQPGEEVFAELLRKYSE